MGIKEARREIIEANAPLRRHSINQRKLKFNLEGERRVANISSVVIPKTREEDSPILEQLLGQDLPLSQTFLQEFLPVMLEVAQSRVGDEENKLLTIPRRVTNIISDVQKIYKLAKAVNLHTEMVDSKPINLLELHFPQRRETSFYRGLFSYQIFLALLNKEARWRQVPDNFKNVIFGRFFKAFTINLTSCNFSLPPQELVPERVGVYSYVSATLATMGQPFPPKAKEQIIDGAFTQVLEISKQQLLRR